MVELFSVCPRNHIVVINSMESYVVNEYFSMFQLSLKRRHISVQFCLFWPATNILFFVLGVEKVE